MLVPVSTSALFRVSQLVNVATRNMAYVSNKRITRLLSEIEVDKSELKNEGNEKYVDVRLTNKNPRNLEQMLLAQKPMGFEFDKPNRHYWNKVVFEKKSKFLVGKIVHNSGRTVVSVSTKESAIASSINSLNDVNAASVVGQLLALRALECGINSVFYDQNENTQSSKFLAFVNSLEENGLNLSEQPFIFARSRIDN